jgi:ferredoxin--NADP+ reductase
VRIEETSPQKRTEWGLQQVCWSERVHMFEIVTKRHLAPRVNLVEISAPEIAKKARTGQFVIVCLNEKGERIPLTIVKWEPEKGTITLIIQQVGVSTKRLEMLETGDAIRDVVGPLEKTSEIGSYGSVAVVGGGIGTALAYPIVKTLKEAGNSVVSIIGARTAELLILEDEVEKVSDELYIATNDGSKGLEGFVTDVLKVLLEKKYHFDLVYVVGPVLMMKAVADVTKSYHIKTVVSLNPIMVDGTGMCGSCRVSVGYETKFACVDGPKFDGHQVNFDELLSRQGVYIDEEKRALSRYEKTEER